MVKLIIPTRNRPTSLAQVLGFIARFYPSSQVVIADGSDEERQAANRRTAETLSGEIDIDHRSYPLELPFFERMLDVVQTEGDDVLAIGADDDFPMMDTLEEGAQFLLANPDFSTALAALVHLMLTSPEEVSARLGVVRQLAQPNALLRARKFAAWPFSTSYAVTRREHLLERYRRARRLALASFFDFAVGLHDCMAGKVKALDGVGFICTRNFNHSYFRADDKLILFRRSAEVLSVVAQLKQDLIDFGGVSEAEADSAAARLIMRRVAELAGAPAHTQEGFQSSGVFQNKWVQGQLELFHLLFEPGNPVREAYAERLAHIAAAMQASAASDDNRGEPKTYELVDTHA